jgi:hypothetical protein
MYNYYNPMLSKILKLQEKRLTLGPQPY